MRLTWRKSSQLSNPKFLFCFGETFTTKITTKLWSPRSRKCLQPQWFSPWRVPSVPVLPKSSPLTRGNRCGLYTLHSSGGFCVGTLLPGEVHCVVMHQCTCFFSFTSSANRLLWAYIKWIQIDVNRIRYHRLRRPKKKKKHTGKRETMSFHGSKPGFLQFLPWGDSGWFTPVMCQELLVRSWKYRATLHPCWEYIEGAKRFKRYPYIESSCIKYGFVWK